MVVDHVLVPNLERGLKGIEFLLGKQKELVDLLDKEGSLIELGDRLHGIYLMIYKLRF